MEYWEERYNDLLWNYRYRGDKIDELEKELGKVRDEKDSAEFKIRNELEPRIKSEKDSYDSWALSPTRGMPEGCKQDCLACKNLECDSYQDYLSDEGINVDILNELADFPYTFEIAIKHYNQLNKSVKEFNALLNEFEVIDGSPFKDVSRSITKEDLIDGLLYVNKNCTKVKVLNITNRNSKLKFVYDIVDYFILKNCRVINDKYMGIIDEM